MIGRFTPGEASGAAVSVRSELRALRSVRLWLVLGATVLVMGGCMGTFSFISPLLTERSGIPLGLVPLVFVCFGVGSMIGTNGVGRFADRRPVATLIACALAAGLVLVLLIPLSANPVTAVIVITLLGAVTMAIPPVATGLSVRLAGSAPTLAAAFAVSAFNGGIAAGSSIGGHTLDTSLGADRPGHRRRRHGRARPHPAGRPRHATRQAVPRQPPLPPLRGAPCARVTKPERKDALMRATIMYAAGDVRVEDVPDATIVDPTDAVVRVTRACICGSDLWPYASMEPSETGQSMGHEAIGVVEDVGARRPRRSSAATSS